jgi:putative tricarboxylic transport membrane protein
MYKKDLISGVFFFLIALGICLESIRIDLGNLKKPGTSFFPFLGGIVLLLLSLGLVFKFYLSKRELSEDQDDKTIRWRNVILVALLILVYTYVLDYLGYLISTFILMAFLFRSVEYQPWWIVFVGAVCSSGFSYLLFQVWLKVELPRGIF